MTWMTWMSWIANRNYVFISTPDFFKFSSHWTDRNRLPKPSTTDGDSARRWKSTGLWPNPVNNKKIHTELKNTQQLNRTRLLNLNRKSAANLQQVRHFIVSSVRVVSFHKCCILCKTRKNKKKPLSQCSNTVYVWKSWKYELKMRAKAVAGGLGDGVRGGAVKR